nr:MAG TPA: hypothetical protein [Caudoviricetes sp.]DAS08434.1 MAG TPA: hypothetical protein [Caudoviricetes sp.]
MIDFHAFLLSFWFASYLHMRTYISPSTFAR